MGSLQPHTAPTAAAKLRKLLSDRSRILVAPGAYDGISARVALSLGFEALYMVSDEDVHLNADVCSLFTPR